MRQMRLSRLASALRLRAGTMSASNRPAWGAPGHPDQVVFRTDLVTIGAFRCAVDDPCFNESGPLPQPCFVFPRTCTTIQYPDRPAFVADPTVVTMFNAGQRYQRKPLSRAGDECDWYGVEPGVLRDAIRPVDPAAADSPDRIVRRAFGANSAALYVRQRELFRSVRAALAPDALAVEDEVCALLRAVVQHVYRRSAAESAAPLRRHGTAAVEIARALVARRFHEPLTLRTIARAAGTSPFQLSRHFREATGTTVHRYRARLRLRSSLELVESRMPLTDVALALGYSSHSHFTQAFRAEFGAAPTHLVARRELARRQRRR